MDDNKGTDTRVAKVGGTTEISDDMRGEGNDRRELLKKVKLSSREEKAINFWKLCEGDMVVFKNLCNGEDYKGVLRSLNTEKVRTCIGWLSELGECLPLIAEKWEVEQCLTMKMRCSGDLDAIDKLNRMRGYYPKDSNGGTVIQILVGGNLED